MKLEERITNALTGNPPMSINEIYLALGRECKLTTLSQRLATMAREGTLKRAGSGVYAIADK